MRRAGYDGACWPDERQTAILRCALIDPEIAAHEWEALRRKFSTEEIWSVNSQRLLPLVMNNLQEAQYEEPDADRSRAIRRRTWSKNTRLIHATKPVLRELQAAGVETLLLKGVPLAYEYYGDLGLRPMSDVDVLVPLDAYDTALDVLESNGFRTELDIPRGRLLRMYHGVGFRHPDGHVIDLHWQLALPLHLPHAASQSTSDFFSAATPLHLGDVTVSTLCSADMLLHVVVHGLWAGSDANDRWVADAAVVVRRAGRELDWSRLVSQTIRRDLVVPLSNALRYLVEVVDSPVPPDVIRELLGVPVPMRTRRAYRWIMRSSTVSDLFGGLANTWAFWTRQSYKRNRWRAARDLPWFVQDLWRLDHVSEVPVEAVRKALKRLSGVAQRNSRLG